MPGHPVISLRTPWWTLWGLERLKEASPLGSTMLVLWLGKLEAIRRGRHIEVTTIARNAGMVYKQFAERRTGQTFGKSSLPVNELYLLAGALDVEINELLPTRRELFTLATANLIGNYEKSNPDRTEFQLPRAAPSAYVEYHFAKPDRNVHDVLDRAAVARAHTALGGRLTRVEETREALIAIGNAIDVIYFSL